MKVKNVVLKTKLCATFFDIYVLISILCNNYIVLFMICQKFRSYCICIMSPSLNV